MIRRRVAGGLEASLLVAALSACAPTKEQPALGGAVPPRPSARAATTAALASSAGADGGAKERPFDEVAKILALPPETCAAETGGARIRCAIDAKYAADPKAAALGSELWSEWGILPGVEPAQTMDGGYRGMIRLEPEVPVNAERRHLEWIVSAMRDLTRFWAKLDEREAPHAGTPARYRYVPLTLRFMRSTGGKRTPSAYAYDWTVAWNVVGSLHRSEEAVRDTLVHEIFHLNDRVHAITAGGWWSESALGADYDAIVKRCGVSRACLAPFAPNGTTVRGGTYYAFQPGNGVVEYGAELALRYYREQRAVLFALSSPKAFKCGPPENARAWGKMRDEFFGGVDVVPDCRR